jgi:hypothetical protein
LGSGEVGECIGLDCGETGTSTDGRFFNREPGIGRGRKKEEYRWEIGPCGAWGWGVNVKMRNAHVGPQTEG